MNLARNGITVSEVTDPTELAAARAQRAQFDRNSFWLQQHITDVYSRFRGKFICIAGQEIFSGNSVKEAIAAANSAHPEDRGWFTRYVPSEKASRIYAI
jgi:hypothetical protein